MDLKAFQNRIEKSSFLPKEARDDLLKKAENFTPEIRSGIIKKLESHEDRFLEEADKRLQKIQEQESLLIKRQGKEADVRRVKNRLIADAQAKADMHFL